MGGIDWTGLLKGMGLLALSVSGGLALGKAIIALSLPERLLGSLLPRLRRLRIPAQALFALGVSLGSSRAGSALVAEAYGQGILSEREALFGTLLQSFPGYLKRWLVSFPVAAALAGTAGAIYSAAVLARSFCRFLLFLFLLRGRGATENEESVRGTEGRRGRNFPSSEPWRGPCRPRGPSTPWRTWPPRPCRSSSRPGERPSRCFRRRGGPWRRRPSPMSTRPSAWRGEPWRRGASPPPRRCWPC